MVQPQQTHRPPLRSVLDAYVNITAAAYNAKAGDRMIEVNRAGAVTITLPTAQLRAGRSYTIKDESGAAATNNITVATEGSETIDGSATDTISDNYGSKTYYSDGTNWFTVPLLAVLSHTLASHSAKAHSDLTGIGTGDHHAQSHTLDSHTGTLQHEKGGLEADVNAGDGFVEIKAGATTVIKSNTAATAAPGATDDSAAGYAVGSVWINTTADKAYVCLDATATAAVWTEITQSGGGTEATKTDIEDEGTTNADRYVSPEVAKNAPGAAKAYLRLNGTGGLVTNSDYNLTSTGKDSTGIYTHTWATDFSSDAYAGFSSPNTGGDDTQQALSYAAGTMKTENRRAGALQDGAGTAIAFGKQV